MTPEACGWAYSSLRVLELGPGAEAAFRTGPDEMLVLPLAGAAVVTADGVEFALDGLPDVFSRVTDFAYLPAGAAVTVRSAAGGRFALPGARAGRRLPPRYGPADQVPVEIRGSGQATRQVNNFCAPDAFETDRLVSVEVLTPAGNWSSYPPHKHDQARPGEAVSRRSTTSRSGPAGTGPGSATSGSTRPIRAGRSTCWPRCAPATSCWSRTATTGPRWRPPATTCTTSRAGRAGRAADDGVL